jgi:hypothetical protein
MVSGSLSNATCDPQASTEDTIADELGVTRSSQSNVESRSEMPGEDDLFREVVAGYGQLTR